MGYEKITETSGVVSGQARNALAWITGAAALVLFWLTLSPTAFPGDSATMTAVRLGIDPRLTPDHPLTLLCTSFVRLLPLSSAVYALNLWSALCGAVAAGLLCRYVIIWIDSRIVLDDELGERDARRAVLLGAGFAALAFATGASLWIAATRFHVAAFHAVLLLLAFSLLQDVQAHGRALQAYALALLCGLGCAESALFLLLTPYFAAMLLVALYRHNAVPWRRVTGLAVVGLLGASLYGWAAWHFAAVEDVSLRGYSGRFAIAVQMFLDQLGQVAAMLPSTGWIWIVVFAVVPWLAVQFEIWHGLNRRNDMVAMVFHVLLTIMALLVQSNAAFLPWSSALPSGRLPLVEGIFTAMVIGYLAVFWLLRYFDPAFRAPPDDASGGNVSQSADLRMMRGVGALMCLLLAFSVLLAGGRMLAHANGGRAAFADGYVAELLKQTQSRDWIVTDGLMDVKLRIAAAESGRTLRVLDLGTERHVIPIRHLRRTINEDPTLAEHRSAYRNAASLGAVAFIQEWLALDADALARLAFYAPPDLLLEAGLEPVPDRMLFLPANQIEPLRDRALLAEHEEYWTRMESLLSGAVDGDAVDRLRGVLRRHVSLAANNLGVLLEDLGRPEDAYAAYLRALSFDPDNFSAMLNRVVLVRAGIAPQDAKMAEADALVALEKIKRLPQARRLTLFYGYVRTPNVFARQSSEWMRFGRPRMAISALKRAADLAPEEGRIELRAQVAFLELAQGNQREAESSLLSIVAQAPTHVSALIGLYRIALERRDLEAARKWMEKVRQTGIRAESLMIEEASLDVLAGRVDDALAKLQDITDHNPKNLQAWSQFANLLLDQKRVSEVERTVLPRMRTAAGNTPNYFVFLTQGFLNQAKGIASFPAARVDLLNALRLQPGSRVILTELLRLDMALRDRAMMEQRARQLLRVERDDALANYVMGTLLLERDERADAIEHFRRSTRAAPSARGFNDLAEALRLDAQLAAAEAAVREALRLDPRHAYAYDTLACVLLDTERLEEARAASAEARRLDDASLPLMLTEARILARSGETVEVRDLLRRIGARSEQLSPQQRAEWERLNRDLRSR